MIDDKMYVLISKELLNKLKWAYPSGDDEQRVEFCLNKIVEESEDIEGIKYHANIPPCKTFEHIEVRTQKK